MNQWIGSVNFLPIGSGVECVDILRKKCEERNEFIDDDTVIWKKSIHYSVKSEDRHDEIDFFSIDD